MTREEAIMKLQKQKAEYLEEWVDFSGVAEAYDMAIKALTQPEIIRCKDCKNWDTTWQNDWAKNYHYCPLIDGTRNGDWYCADAERITNER